jgi:hypothetical protein
MLEALVASDLLQHLPTIHARHVQVEQNQVWRRRSGVITLFTQISHALLAVRHVIQIDRELSALKTDFHQLDIVVVVLDEQDFCRSTAGSNGSHLPVTSGIVK